MKASEFIAQLEQMIIHHGDDEVIARCPRCGCEMDFTGTIHVESVDEKKDSCKTN